MGTETHPQSGQYMMERGLEKSPFFPRITRRQRKVVINVFDISRMTFADSEINNVMLSCPDGCIEDIRSPKDYARKENERRLCYVNHSAEYKQYNENRKQEEHILRLPECFGGRIHTECKKKYERRHKYERLERKTSVIFHEISRIKTVCRVLKTV